MLLKDVGFVVLSPGEVTGDGDAVDEVALERAFRDWVDGLSEAHRVPVLNAEGRLLGHARVVSREEEVEEGTVLNARLDRAEVEVTATEGEKEAGTCRLTVTVPLEERRGTVPRTLGDRFLGEERAHRMRNRLKHLTRNLPDGVDRRAALNLVEDVETLEEAAQAEADRAYEAGVKDGADGTAW